MIPQIAGYAFMGLFDFLTGGRQYRVTGTGGEDRVFKTQEEAQDYLRGKGHSTYTFRPLEGDEQSKLSTTRPRTTMSPRSREDGGKTGLLSTLVDRFKEPPQPVYDYPGSRVDRPERPSVAAPTPVAPTPAPPMTGILDPGLGELTDEQADYLRGFGGDYFDVQPGDFISEDMVGILDDMPSAPTAATPSTPSRNPPVTPTPPADPDLPLQAMNGIPWNMLMFGDPLGRGVSPAVEAASSASDVDAIFARLRANPMYQMLGDDFLRRLAQQEARQ